MSAERVSSQTRVCLWVVGAGAEAFSIGKTVGDRYEIIAPRIWKDLTPATPPQVPESMPETVLPYLKAHAHRLHIPNVYDVVTQKGKAPLVLLENAAVNSRSGDLYPDLLDQWQAASSVRQMSWLWQTWQLWDPLNAMSVARSLLAFNCLRVEGWRIRLLELMADESSPSLIDLGRHWQALIPDAQPAIATPLAQLCEALMAGTLPAEQLTIDLNYLLLKEAARHRPRLQIAGQTHPGPKHSRNEDACYPEGELPDLPMPRMAIVCDGVGGHEAGEVASQVVVRSLQPQLQGLIAESGREEHAVPPAVVAQQIEASIRVVNDLVNTQNDSQSRSDRQRMGTTLVMALMIPQRLKTPQGWIQVDELYIAHVGDSRAYWITPDYCHQLTVDDDIAGRESIAGRAFYAATRDRPEAGALTQAIGTRSSQYLTPHVQRFVMDEEGVLLLCSDGLSDHHQVENAWANYIGLITKNIISLPSAVASLIELANQKNGHDNVSVVLIQVKPTAETANATTSSPPSTEEQSQEDLTDASKALLYGEEEDSVAAEQTGTDEASQPLVPRWWIITVAISILFFAGVAGWWVAGRLAPGSRPDVPDETELSE